MNRAAGMRSVIAIVALSLFVRFPAAAESPSGIPGAANPLAFGADVGSVLGGALMSAVEVSVFADLPVSRGWSLEVSPSAYWSEGTGLSVFQATIEVAARYYLMSLFIKDPARQTQWGPYAGLGFAAAWVQETSGQAAATSVAAGPMAKLGYRLVFGDHGLFAEPYLGWMGLYPVFGASNWTSGAFGGLSLGCRL